MKTHWTFCCLALLAIHASSCFSGASKVPPAGVFGQLQKGYFDRGFGWDSKWVNGMNQLADVEREAILDNAEYFEKLSLRTSILNEVSNLIKDDGGMALLAVETVAESSGLRYFGYAFASRGDQRLLYYWRLTEGFQKDGNPVPAKKHIGVVQLQADQGGRLLRCWIFVT